MKSLYGIGDINLYPVCVKVACPHGGGIGMLSNSVDEETKYPCDGIGIGISYNSIKIAIVRESLKYYVTNKYY
jgi:hypothetical protein